MRNALLIVSLLAARCFCGDVETIECRWATGPIKIDGVADEAAWKNAAVISHFGLHWLKDNPRAPKTKTTAKLLWDHEAIYFFAEMEDTNLTARITKHDDTAWIDDVFELFFKPALDKSGYYEFEVNANNAVLDMFMPERDPRAFPKFATDPPFTRATAVKLNGTINKHDDVDKGWMVEGKFSWRDFLPTGGRPNPDEIWHFTLCRGDVGPKPTDEDLTATAPLSKLSFHQHENYQPLRFVREAAPADRPFGIAQRIAFNDSKVVGSPEPPPPFTVQRAYEKLTIPNAIHVYHEPGTKNLFVINQTISWGGVGRLYRVADEPTVEKLEELWSPDRLLYGLAFDPDYEKNGHLYIGSNGPQSKKEKTTSVSRVTIDRNPPHGIVPGSEVTIIEWPSDGHNGGDLVFGKDGMLYVTSGDGTSDSDRDVVGQDLTKLNAKVLRIDVRNPDAGKLYSVPKDNPFVGQENVRAETWAYGLRNPWRIASDKVTGHIWVGNNGQDLWEQAYLVQKGANYGWSIQEGSKPFYLDRKRGPHPISAPTLEHAHSEARSLTGGQVYYGQKYPELRGMYIYGDFSTGKIWGARHDGAKLTDVREIADTTLRITGFNFDSSGELLVVDHGGGLYRFERSPNTQANTNFPRRLSDTGLFASVVGHKPHPALIPYSVNAPLWSDGTYKERFIALPGSSSMSLTQNRGWDFPDGSVLVKSFALNGTPATPTTRRWIETRLLVKQKGQWAGFSYKWNDAQTDAELVEREGADVDYAVADATAPGGQRAQKWHYPSRTECMVCHSRAFNFVLGPSTLQMNKDHDYNGIVDNQLRTLEHIGALGVNYGDAERKQVERDGRRQGLVDKPLDDFKAKWSQRKNQREAPLSGGLLWQPHTKLTQRLVDPYDAKQDLTQRVRSYLHANCAQCHVEAGGGNAAMEMDFSRALKDTNLIDVTPNHDHFGIANAKLIASGDPERSVLLKRISQRGPGQMPPLATSIPDTQAIQLIREWISSLKLPVDK